MVAPHYGGDRLVLAVPGCPRLVTAVMGALRVGIVPVVLDPATPPTELHALIDDADPALVIDSVAALDELHAHALAELAPVPLVGRCTSPRAPPVAVRG